MPKYMRKKAENDAAGAENRLLGFLVAQARSYQISIWSSFLPAPDFCGVQGYRKKISTNVIQDDTIGRNHDYLLFSLFLPIKHLFSSGVEWAFRNRYWANWMMEIIDAPEPKADLATWKNPASYKKLTHLRPYPVSASHCCSRRIIYVEHTVCFISLWPLIITC